MENEPAVADRADLDRMVARLESNLETFHTNTKAARSATSEYGSQLEAHVSDLEQVTKTGELVPHLAHKAKVMLERKRNAEDEMRTRTAETNDQRRTLARPPSK